MALILPASTLPPNVERSRCTVCQIQGRRSKASYTMYHPAFTFATAYLGSHVDLYRTLCQQTPFCQFTTPLTISFQRTRSVMLLLLVQANHSTSQGIYLDLMHSNVSSVRGRALNSALCLTTYKTLNLAMKVAIKLISAVFAPFA